MDLLLFQKILDRRAQLQAELNEIDGFLRQAESFATRLIRAQAQAPAGQHAEADNDIKVCREPPAFQTADGRRWPPADIGSLPRDIVSR